MRNFTLKICLGALLFPAISTAQLSDCYGPDNWTIHTENTTGSVTIDETTMVITNDTDFSGSNSDDLTCDAADGLVSACITAESAGTISFDWSVEGGFFFNPLVERFGYCLNGVSTELTSLDPPPFGTTSGSASIEVQEGDQICFLYNSKFADGQPSPATLTNFSMPDCPVFGDVPGLTDCFAADNWTINTENTTGSVTIDETSMVITNDTDFSGSNADDLTCDAADGLVSACITAAASGVISFDWSVEGGFFFNPLVERFGYCLNGVSTELTSLDPPPFGTTSGSVAIEVQEGDEICFLYNSKFADGQPFPATLTNFMMPECPLVGDVPGLTDCFAADNWTINTENTTGSVTIDETTMVITNDTDFAGSNSDDLTCDAADGLVSACITAAASGVISFDWSVEGGFFFNPLVERFGYCLNGVSTELTSLDPPPFGTTSGSVAIEVQEGDEICFLYNSKFADGQPFPATLTNFMMPECPLVGDVPGLTDCFAADNWAINTENTTGSVTIDETTMVIINDTDFAGSNTDNLTCDAADGLVSACITAAASGVISFDWSVEGGFFFNPLVERFGYCLNGVSTELTSLDPPPFGTTSGSVAIEVQEGDEICFLYNSKFADGQPFPATLTNFMMPECPAQPLELNIEVSPEMVLCHGDETASITATITGGAEPYTLTWDTEGMEGSDIDNIGAGTYCLTVMDAEGAEVESCVTISEPEALAIEMSSTEEMDDNIDGTATATVSGGTPEYTYVWNTDPEQNSATAENLATGDYEVVVTDANGCTISGSVFVDHITGLNDLDGITQFQVFPNPASSTINLQLQLETAEAITLQIVDVQGKLVFEQFLGTTAFLNENVDIQHLENGVYMILVSNQSKVARTRIIKQ